MSRKADVIKAIINEIELSQNYLPSKTLNSIYFGGGTPSLLEPDELSDIMEAIAKSYHWDENAEITIETNPDDINSTKVREYKRLGINRWSIGIQSFHEGDLRYMNRAHSSDEGARSIKLVQDAGFDDITIDLIYGTPTMDHQAWMQNIEKSLEYGIDHLSCYALTVEENTALEHFIKTAKSPPVDAERSRKQFEMLMGALRANEFEHYEISNFARNGKYAVHNTSYWQSKPYLGIGPSAHSFNGQARRWNVSNNIKYLRSVQDGIIPYEEEVLSASDRCNEYIMTSLRTMWGMNIDNIDSAFRSSVVSMSNKKVQEGLMMQDGTIYRLTEDGKHFADFVAMDLFQ